MDYIFASADPKIEPVYYAIAVVIALLIGLLLFRRYRQERINKERAIALLLLIEYIFLVFSSTVLSRTPQGYYNYELIPFWSYRKIMAGSKALFWEDLLNVVMLMPLGILLPLAWKRVNSAKRVILVGFLISLTIELLQLIFQRGLFEFDDMFHNTLGVSIGYWSYCRIKKMRE